jgi:hypothetical protein
MRPSVARIRNVFDYEKVGVAAARRARHGHHRHGRQATDGRFAVEVAA